MTITRFPHGVSSFGMPILGSGDLVTTGNVFFVQYTDGNDGIGATDGNSPDNPFKTLDYAIGQCTANHGDIIILMPGHAETTTAIALDVAGIRIVGLGVGRTRPTLTATTGASDLIDVTAANCWIENIRLVGAASGCTALIDVAANDLQVINCSIEHGAAPLMAITNASGARLKVIGCQFLGTADGPDCAIDFEATLLTDFIIKDCLFNYGRFGCDLGCIRAATDHCEGGWIDNCVFIGMDTVAVDFNSSSQANIAGIISNCTLGMGAATANIDVAIDAGSYGLFNVFCTDIVAERGANIPVTSPA